MNILSYNLQKFSFQCILYTIYRKIEQTKVLLSTSTSLFALLQEFFMQAAKAIAH